MSRAVLGLGGNLGTRRALLECARSLLAAQPGLRICAVSRLYHTAPLGPPQPDYLNAALAVEWVGAPRALLALTQHVEMLLGRQRAERWGARTLDIDILHWSGGPVREPGLRVPHPELMRRAFALVPLLEVAPELSTALGVAPGSVDPGFAPSEPFEAPLRVEPDGTLWLGPMAEPLELACAFVGSAWRLLAPAQPLPPSASILPFRCALAAEGGLDALLESLWQRVLAAARHGFFARNAAILSVGAGKCEGVFVGARATLPAAPLALHWTLLAEARGPALRLNHV